MKRDFPDVFPDELSSLPPERDIDFAIDFIHDTKHISLQLCRMAHDELNELNSQLQEMVDKGFVRPNVSPWGAPVLFVKKNDGILMTKLNF